MDLIPQAMACRGNQFGQRSYNIVPRQPYIDPRIFIEDAVLLISDFLHRVQQKTPFRVQFCMRSNLEKLDGSECTPVFNTKFITVLESDNVDEIIDQAMGIIYMKLEDFQEMGSGWCVHHIDSMDLHIGSYKPYGGSSYVELPNYIKEKKAVLNIKNKDNKCFLWSVLAALHPIQWDEQPSRVSHYRPYEEDLNVQGLSCPMKISDLKKFEEQNNISIYLYGHEDEEKGITPMHISKYDHPQRVVLLLYKGHYCTIRSLDRLTADKNGHGQMKWCPACLWPFRKQEACDEHFVRCRRGDPAKVVMPKEEETLKFTHAQRGLEAPLTIYADFECLLEKLQGPAKTRYTKDYQLHTPRGYALLPVQRSCGEVTFLPHKVYRGDDAVENFMESVIELARNHHNNMKKPLSMTREDNIKFRGATECHICKKPFEEDPVRDHCHLTGKFRGAANNKCNLDFRVNKDITVGFHNLRRYDQHLIMQKLEKCATREVIWSWK